MVLADYQIEMEVRKERLRFRAPEDAPFQIDQIQASSVDLRLGHFFRKLLTPDEIRGQKIPGVTETLEVDPSARDFDVMQLLKAYGKVEIPEGKPYPLRPHDSVLAQTLEKVQLPIYLAARVEGRSQLARLGMTIHNTAPTIGAGFSGRIALEITNHGPFTINLFPRKLRICQLILEPVMPPPENPYQGQFTSQEIV